MLKSRALLRGEITYEDAKESDTNILHELGYRDQKIRFFTYLYRNHELIRSIITSHLGVTSREKCHLVDVEDWIHGNFNVCIQADILGSRGVEKQVMIRFPLPYRIGEDPCPRNADEKVRCKAGTYTWLKENCPTMPIPRFYGYGLSNGKTVSLLFIIFLHFACNLYICRQFVSSFTNSTIFLFLLAIFNV